MSPAIVVYNPPVGVRRSMPRGAKFVGLISERVLDLDYVHAENGKEYTHSFRDFPGVQMFAIEGPDGSRSILLVGTADQVLWDDFDV